MQSKCRLSADVGDDDVAWALFLIPSTFNFQLGQDGNIVCTKHLQALFYDRSRLALEIVQRLRFCLQSADVIECDGWLGERQQECLALEECARSRSSSVRSYVWEQ
jgi:hypothetical protein